MSAGGELDSIGPGQTHRAIKSCLLHESAWSQSDSPPRRAALLRARSPRSALAQKHACRLSPRSTLCLDNLRLRFNKFGQSIEPARFFMVCRFSRRTRPACECCLRR